MFDEGEVKQHKLSENNDCCYVVTIVSYLKRVKNTVVSPVIVHMNFFEAMVDTRCTRRVGILYLNQIIYQLLAWQLDPPEGEMEDGRGVGREGGRKRGRVEEVRQGKKEEVRQRGRSRKGRVKEARQGGGRREGRPFERS